MHPNHATLHAYVDAALEPLERTEVDRHLDACEPCRQLVDDLREIRRVSGSLGLREPPARAWRRIERAIQMERAVRSGQDARLNASRYTFAWLAAAAALVLATAVGLRFFPSGRGNALPTAPEKAAASVGAQEVEAELREAEAHYEKAIRGLEQITSSEQSALDPRTAATLQKNLAIIDQAIGESRTALRAQPNSEPAQQSLIDSFKTKVALLQDTVALINEMRKGNDAGAARIVSGLTTQPKGN